MVGSWGRRGGRPDQQRPHLRCSRQQQHPGAREGQQSGGGVRKKQPAGPDEDEPARQLARTGNRHGAAQEVFRQHLHASDEPEVHSHPQRDGCQEEPGDHHRTGKAETRREKSDGGRRGTDGGDQQRLRIGNPAGHDTTHQQARDIGGGEHRPAGGTAVAAGGQHGPEQLIAGEPRAGREETTDGAGRQPRRAPQEYTKPSGRNPGIRVVTIAAGGTDTFPDRLQECRGEQEGRRVDQDGHFGGDHADQGTGDGRRGDPRQIDQRRLRRDGPGQLLALDDLGDHPPRRRKGQGGQRLPQEQQTADHDDARPGVQQTHPEQNLHHPRQAPQHLGGADRAASPVRQDTPREGHHHRGQRTHRQNGRELRHPVAVTQQREGHRYGGDAAAERIERLRHRDDQHLPGP